MTKIVVVGAHHGVGALAVDRLRARGHDVIAFEGDALDEQAVATSLKGVSAVVSLLGPRKGSPADLCTRGTRHILDAMRVNGVRRLVQVTGAMIGHPRERLGWIYRFIESRVPAAALADRREQERLVVESGVAWTLLRPTRLTNGPARGTWRSAEQERIGAFASISRSDVAEQIAGAIDDDRTIGAKLTLQY
ncbi:MAG: NAD(P)H-binding protein [Deltaproteobacteria bacterium]|nr:NAD(P)H-binding protein [Deltaproteobacteria bacterium]